MVFVVMNLHRLSIDVRFQGVVVVWQWWKFECHGIILLAKLKNILGVAWHPLRIPALRVSCSPAQSSETYPFGLRTCIVSLQDTLGKWSLADFWGCRGAKPPCIPRNLLMKDTWEATDGRFIDIIDTPRVL